MYCISEQQIDYILSDISARGVKMESLQLNLLDHVCCIIEQQLEDNGNFERFYSTAIRSFYERELREIEEETIFLLNNKNYYKMKKLMIGSGIFSALLLTFGIALKFMYKPGAGICIVIALVLLSLVFLPLMFMLRIKEKQSARDRILIAISAICAMALSLSVLFKIQHWPGANMMGSSSIGILLLLFLPVYFITGFRNAATRVNTIVSSVLIIAGCGLYFSLIISPKGIEMMNINNTAAFMRNEQILHTEQKLAAKANRTDTVAAPLLAQGKKINQLCEDLKTAIVQDQTGLTALNADYESKKAFIHDDHVDAYLKDDTIGRKVEELRSAVQMYNSGYVGHADLQQISLKSTVLDQKSIGFERVPGMLNDLVQIQMVLLQNEQELLAVK